MDLFFEIHRDLPREGPGDEASTSTAYALMAGLPANPRILDIGCGPGMQTLTLARLSGGQVTAIDTHEPFLVVLNQKAQGAGLAGQITTRNMSMTALDFPPASFDVIWSEGAIYIMGVDEALRAWKPYLKTGGYLAFTEVCWLKPNVPEEALAYWEREYPQIRAVPMHMAAIKAAGYRLRGHFALPPSSWWDDYYRPLQDRLMMLRSTYADNPVMLEMIAANQEEIDIFHEYHTWYSYVFYVAQVI